MKIRRDLLAIKGHFFFMSAGTSPILPYIPIIAKGLGFSSVAVGWAYSVAPIFTIIVKPFVGSFADKFSCRKLCFVLIALLQVIGIFSIQWLPSLPSDASVIMNVNNDTNLVACSTKLENECYSARVLSILNSSLACELDVPGIHNGSLPPPPGEPSVYERQQIQLGGGRVLNSCVSMTITNATNLFALRRSPGSTTAQLYCNNEAIREITKKPLLDDAEIYATHQFWLFFFVVVGITTMMSLCYNLGDTLCLSLLGDRPEDYGMERMWGSVGWGTLSMVGGYLVDRMSRGKAEKDFTPAYYLCLVLLIINLIICTRVKSAPYKRSKNIFKDVSVLFTNSKTKLFVTWSIFSGIYAAMISNFIFWFIEDLAGQNGCADNSYIKTLEGLVLTVHCYCGEIPFFFLSGWIIRKIGHDNVMRLIIFTHAGRFLIYWLLTNPWWILPIEALNGITKGLDYSFITIYAGIIAPTGTEATVQSLVTAISNGIGNLIGNLIGGYLFKVVGTSRTYLYLSTSAFIFGTVLIVIQRVIADKEAVLYSGVNTESKDTEKGTNTAEKNIHSEAK